MTWRDRTPAGEAAYLHGDDLEPVASRGSWRSAMQLLAAHDAVAAGLARPCPAHRHYWLRETAGAWGCVVCGPEEVAPC